MTFYSDINEMTVTSEVTVISLCQREVDYLVSVRLPAPMLTMKVMVGPSPSWV